jgi:hypothetical protein
MYDSPINNTKGEANMTHIKALKPFDYLNAGEIYRVWAVDKTHTRFWNDEKDCGTFIANWAVENALKAGLLEEVA